MKRVLPVIGLIVILLATACTTRHATSLPATAGLQLATQTPTSARIETPTPTATLTPTTEPTPTPTVIPTVAPVIFAAYDPAMLEVVANLNTWRITQGLWPLKLNADLQALAQAQAEYLLTLDTLPDGGEIHRDANGDLPPQRALNAGWPYYNNRDQVAATEIAYVGADVSAAITFWQGSQIHSRASLNPAYREIGAAVLPHRFGHLYIVVLGSRPNVLTALADPISGTLYLSSEKYGYAQQGEFIKDVNEVYFPGESATEDVWLTWQAAMPIPPALGTQNRIFFSDGSREVTVDFDLTSDLAWLPENLSLNGTSLTR